MVPYVAVFNFAGIQLREFKQASGRCVRDWEGVDWSGPELFKICLKGLSSDHSVDGRNPANHLGCKKSCKYGGKLPINRCRISFHQQYHHGFVTYVLCAGKGGTYSTKTYNQSLSGILMNQLGFLAISQVGFETLLVNGCFC